MFLFAVGYCFAMKTMYVYIMSSKSAVLYVGVTNNIKRRVYEHKNHLVKGFTDKYGIDRLVYYETIRDPISAIEREKEVKAWRREKKVKLIDSINPSWDDMSLSWTS